MRRAFWAGWPQGIAPLGPPGPLFECGPYAAGLPRWGSTGTRRPMLTPTRPTPRQHRCRRFKSISVHWPGRIRTLHRTCQDLDERALHCLVEQKSLPAEQTQELVAFRAEAQAVLAGLTGKLPAGIFAPPP